MGVDISRAFRAPFNDPDWVKKTLLGWVWVLLFVTSPAVYGAAIEYIQRVAHGDDRLPEWDDFGGKWVKGFLAAVASFIYFLPIVVIGMILVIPLALSANSNADALTGLLAGGMCLFWVLAAIYGIAVSILFYAAIVNYAMKGHFGAFFEISEILANVRKPGGNYFLAWLFALVVGIGASVVTSVLSLTYIGVILFGAIIYLEFMIIGHLFGQWAADAYGVRPAYAAPSPAGYPAVQPAPPATQPYQQPTPPPAYAPPAVPSSAPAPSVPPAAPAAPPAPATPPQTAAPAPVVPPAPATPPAPAVAAAPEPAPPPVEPVAPASPAPPSQPEPTSGETPDESDAGGESPTP